MIKIILKTAIASSMVLTLSTAAQAKDWYLGGSIGYNQTQDQRSEGQGRLVETEFDAGLVTTSVLGFKYSDNIRLEGEFAWRKNDGSSLAFQGIDRPIAAKGAESYSFLVNALYDIPTDSKFTPYIGAGAGIGFLENEFLYGPVNFEDSDTNFVYQAIAGISLPLTENITGFTDARYFAATGVDFVRNSPADNGISLESEYENFSFTVGYRWNFGN